GALPSVRIGGPDGWRVVFSRLRADIVQPDMTLARASGWAEQDGPDGVEFNVDGARVGTSNLAGAGTLTFAQSGLLYDLRIAGTPLRLTDFQPLFPNLPAE